MQIRDLIRNTLGMTASHTPVPVTLLRAAVIVFLGSCVGVAANALSDRPVPLKTPERAQIKDLIEWHLHVEGMEATLEDADKAFRKGGVWFIDARGAHAYERGHIPGALSMTVSEYRSRKDEVLVGVGKSDPIITYCSGGSCQTSVQLANQMVKDGYTNVRAFYGGWGEWKSAGYPVRDGESP